MNEYPGLVDSHFHLLSLEKRGLDPAECCEEFFAAGGRWALDVAVDAQDWEKRLRWGAREPRLWYTAGVHPSEAGAYTAEDVAAVADQVKHPRCVAVGEIGLDWYRGRDDEQAQRTLFREMLNVAREASLPIVIHNRVADSELREELEAASWTLGGIQHCFSSDQTFARWALDRGFYLSFAGNLTYPANDSLRQVAAWAPLDRLLVETDAPYLSPQPLRGKPNRPVNAGLTAACLAELRRTTLPHLLAVTGDNFARLMKVS